MSSLGTILIGGGSGFIGTALRSKLTAQGYHVVVVSRKPAINTISWPELSEKGLPDECVGVVNLAGQNVMDPTRRWTPGFKQNVVASRVHTNQALAQLIQTSAKPRPKVFASISGVGFYPPSEDREYTEDSEGGDGDFLARLCRDWEAAGDMKSASEVRRVVIRSGVVLGKGGGLMRQMYWPFFFGLGGPVGPGHQFLPWIHLEDLTSLFSFALTEPEVSGVLNGVAPEVVTSREFAKTLGRAMHRPALIPMPASVMDLLLHPERASMVTKGQKVLPRRTLELGFKFQYPKLLEACKACL